MSSELAIKKIYIDSRFKTDDSVSNSNFKIQLKQQIQIPDNTVCYIDDVILPVSWINIDEKNNKLYVRRFEDLTDTYTYRVITVSPNNYTAISLRSEIQDKLNTAFGSGIINVVYNSTTLNFQFSIEVQSEMKVLTDIELKNTTLWQGTGANSYNKDNLCSMNDIITNTIPQSGVNVSTGIIDLRRYHNIYISSPNMSNFSSLGPRGECNIIKKVPITSDFGSIVFDNIVAQHDWIDVSKMSLSIIEFRLSDANGNIIDMRGASLSFSLIFMRFNE